MIQALLQRLARWLDRPLFPWKRLVVGFSLAEFALENWLLFRQYRVLQRTIVPKALDKEIDQETFDKAQVRGLLTFYHRGLQRGSESCPPKPTFSLLTSV